MGTETSAFRAHLYMNLEKLLHTDDTDVTDKRQINLMDKAPAIWEEIPLAARIFAVIDVWDALTSDRPYRPAWPRDKARDLIREEAGGHFDPCVVEKFLEMKILNQPSPSGTKELGCIAGGHS